MTNQEYTVTVNADEPKTMTQEQILEAFGALAVATISLEQLLKVGDCDVTLQFADETELLIEYKETA